VLTGSVSVKVVVAVVMRSQVHGCSAPGRKRLPPALRNVTGWVALSDQQKNEARQHGDDNGHFELAGVTEKVVALTIGTRLGLHEIFPPLGAGGVGEPASQREGRKDAFLAVSALLMNVNTAVDSRLPEHALLDVVLLGERLDRTESADAKHRPAEIRGPFP
jgi:hypothetical protein